MPAAAVIPAPIAYIKTVAVKTLVVGYLLESAGPPQWCVLGASLTSYWRTYVRFAACVHEPELLL